jgi:hypothetical protein
MPRGYETTSFLYALDILKLDGAELRRARVEERKRILERLLRKARPPAAERTYRRTGSSTPAIAGPVRVSEMRPMHRSPQKTPYVSTT